MNVKMLCQDVAGSALHPFLLQVSPFVAFMAFIWPWKLGNLFTVDVRTKEPIRAMLDECLLSDEEMAAYKKRQAQKLHCFSHKKMPMDANGTLHCQRGNRRRKPKVQTSWTTLRCTRLLVEISCTTKLPLDPWTWT